MLIECSKLVSRPFSVISSAILNSYTDYRCTLVPRLPFPVPRSPFPVPGISNTHRSRPVWHFARQTSAIHGQKFHNDDVNR